MHLSSKHFAVEFRNGFSLFLSLSLISKEKKWNTTNRQFYNTASHIQTLDPLRMESGRACRSSASMSTFSWSPRTTMVRLRPRFSFAAVSSFTNGIVFGVHPANLIEATNIKKEAHEQSSKLCLKMSLLPDCTTMLMLYSTRTIHKTREQKTTLYGGRLKHQKFETVKQSAKWIPDTIFTLQKHPP